MRIVIIQHVPFEGPGSIAPWLRFHGHSFFVCQVFAEDALPDVTQIDAAIILGGPMAVSDEDAFPWLLREKRWIRTALESGKKVLGICLGSQLLAESLNAKVFKNGAKEIGWHAVTPSIVGKEKFGSTDPEEFFHWHNDAFDLPPLSQTLGSSAATECQGFLYNDNVIGLLFHPEITKELVVNLLEEESEDLLIPGPYVMPRESILENLEQRLRKS